MGSELGPPPGGYHRLTFLADDIPVGFARCRDCGRLVTGEQWMRERCPARGGEEATP
jgi:NMD protein affecting ribosome stability and mRNA decay